MNRATVISKDPSQDEGPAPEPVRRVTGLFEGSERITEAVQRLVEASFPSEGIDVVVIDAERVEEVPVEQKTRVLEGAVAGTAAGAVLALTVVTVFPGFAVLVGGPVLAALQATATGTIGGALNGLGWWRTEAQVPALGAGNSLVGVAVPVSRSPAAVEALREAGAKRVDVT